MAGRFRSRDVVKMKHFIEEEFQGYYEKMDFDLLIKLDGLREMLGVPIHLSKNPDAIGRGDDVNSWHNFKLKGKVFAVDGYIPKAITYGDFYTACRKVGFTGIGLYTGWKGGRGFHLDTRTDRDPSNPAKWSGTYKDGVNSYGSISTLLS